MQSKSTTYICFKYVKQTEYCNISDGKFEGCSIRLHFLLGVPNKVDGLCLLFVQISLLDSAVNHLKANLKSAADLISLPTTVEELQKVRRKG